MGIVSRAVRNISRRKMRALLVIIALGFSLSIMISIPAGVLANQKTANTVASNLSDIINQTGATINQTLTQIDCSLASSFSGFGFTPPSGTSGGTGTMEAAVTRRRIWWQRLYAGSIRRRHCRRLFWWRCI